MGGSDPLGSRDSVAGAFFYSGGRTGIVTQCKVPETDHQQEKDRADTECQGNQFKAGALKENSGRDGRHQQQWENKEQDSAGPLWINLVRPFSQFGGGEKCVRQPPIGMKPDHRNQEEHLQCVMEKGSIKEQEQIPKQICRWNRFRISHEGPTQQTTGNDQIQK